jgi:hypothetical protein
MLSSRPIEGLRYLAGATGSMGNNSSAWNASDPGQLGEALEC